MTLAQHGTVSRTLVCAALALFAALPLGCNKGRGDGRSLSVPMEYRPKDPLNAAGFNPPAGLKLYVAEVTEKRDQPNQIGANTDDAQAKPIYPAGKSATEFVREVLTRELRETGVDVVTDRAQATRVLETELLRFWVDQAGLYKGDVRARFRLTGANGQEAYNGMQSGVSSHFGRGMSPENFQESFSTATRNLLGNLLSSPEFRNALK